MSFKVKWPVEHDEALKKYHDAGLSFSQISAELWRDFHITYTRNACIGRAARLNLKPRNVSASTARNSGEARVGNTRRTRAKAHTNSGVPAAPRSDHDITAIPRIRKASIKVTQFNPGRESLEPDPTPLRAADVVPLNLTLFELNHDTCRWPYGGWPTDEPITFCGHTTLDKESYCEAHHELSTGRGTLSERQATLVPKCEAA